MFSCGLLSQAAQARREEKKRLEKEKMMLEDDPEKTRKWEVRSLTRDPLGCWGEFVIVEMSVSPHSNESTRDR